MSDFLPDDYDVPAGEGGYMKFEIGENRFRILDKPILGHEYWNEDEEGNRRPVRFRLGEKIPVNELDEPEKGKHFWAMPVWNYAQERVQILEITQKGIQRTITALSKDNEWGSPLKYDILVVRKGEGLKTEYETIPSPPKPVKDEIKEAYEEANINLEALFEGEDPFGFDLSDKEMDEIDEHRTES